MVVNGGGRRHWQWPWRCGDRRTFRRTSSADRVATKLETTAAVVLSVDLADTTLDHRMVADAKSSDGEGSDRRRRDVSSGSIAEQKNRSALDWLGGYTHGVTRSCTLASSSRNTIIVLPQHLFSSTWHPVGHFQAPLVLVSRSITSSSWR